MRGVEVKHVRRSDVDPAKVSGAGESAMQHLTVRMAWHTITTGTKLDQNDRSESCPLSHHRALIAVEPLERLADQLGPRQG